MSWPLCDGVADGDLAGVEEGRVAHEDDLLVVDERVDAAAGAAAQAHAGVVVHERRVGLEHQHGVAAGVAVEDQVHGLAPVAARACTAGRAKSLLDLQQDGWRSRGAGSRGRRWGCGRGWARRRRRSAVTRASSSARRPLTSSRGEVGVLADQRGESLDEDGGVQAAQVPGEAGWRSSGGIACPRVRWQARRAALTGGARMLGDLALDEARGALR